MYDFISMILIFMLMFSTYLFLVDKSERDTFAATSFTELTSLGLSISESFVSNAGVPINWESDPANVQMIGFVSSQNVLDTAKLDAFVAMNYNLSKSKLGIDPFRSYTFTITNSSNDTIYSSGTVPSDSDTIFPFVRYAILNETTVTLRLVLYE